MGRSTAATPSAARLSFNNPDGRVYKLNDDTATLMIRPRGWHLVEKHVLVDGEADLRQSF